MANGTYEEKLRTGGALKVTKDSWEISYYFSGPDLRYTGTVVRVPGSQIDDYISAFEVNFLEYLQLRNNIPQGEEYTKKGKLNMEIRIGGYAECVCIQRYHMPINTQGKLVEVIQDYVYAKKQSKKILKMLSQL